MTIGWRRNTANTVPMFLYIVIQDRFAVNCQNNIALKPQISDILLPIQEPFSVPSSFSDIQPSFFFKLSPYFQFFPLLCSIQIFPTNQPHA